MQMLTSLFGDGLSIFVSENMFVLYRFTLLESPYNKMVINVSYIIICSCQSLRRCAKLVKKKKTTTFFDRRVKGRRLLEMAGL